MNTLSYSFGLVLVFMSEFRAIEVLVCGRSGPCPELPCGLGLRL